jgi:hypothetical protein
MTAALFLVQSALNAGRLIAAQPGDVLLLRGRRPASIRTQGFFALRRYR